jgi:hypothetical protein
MQSFRTVFFALSLLAGCAGPQRGADPVAGQCPSPKRGADPASAAHSPPPESGAADAAISVSVAGWVVTPEAPGGRALAADDAVGEKDRVSLRISLSQPAYLYVLQESGSGGVTPLFPATGHRQIAPGQTLRIPENDSRTLGIDPRGLGERFLIVASRTPLSTAACTVLQLRCGTSSGGGRGGDEQDKGNSQDPDKRGERFVVATQVSAPELATVVTYSVTPRRR